MRVLRRLIPTHHVETTLVSQALIDESPSAVLCLVNFAFAVISATAWTIQQVFVACRNRTDAGGKAKNTVTALGTYLMEVSWTVLEAYEQGIQCWNDRLIDVGS